ncbi:MAG TPA: hypothetical protein VJP80_01760 [Candidatus Saccharimonadales bacterium]|nr:hypothetical protein [Candidatus Saccharimonadales bacterium]
MREYLLTSLYAGELPSARAEHAAHLLRLHQILYGPIPQVDARPEIPAPLDRFGDDPAMLAAFPSTDEVARRNAARLEFVAYRAAPLVLEEIEGRPEAHYDIASIA